MCGEDWFEFFLLGLFGGIGCFYWLWRSYRRYRLIADTPTSRLRSAAQGYIEIIGDCHPLEDQGISAPLTSQPCVWYHYEIAQHVRSGKNSHWRTIEKGTSEAYFVVRDGTGECRVNPLGAEVLALHEDTWYGHSRMPVTRPDEGQGFFSLGLGNYRYTERRIQAQDPIYALGYFETLRPAGLEDGLDGTLRAVIANWKQEYEQLLERFDANGDGTLDADEWQQVRTAARVQAEAELAKLQAAPDVNVLAQSPVGHPFLLSGKNEEKASRRYLWHCVFSLLGFFALGALATLTGSECLLPLLRA